MGRRISLHALVIVVLTSCLIAAWPALASMKRSTRDRAAARNFARMARREGVGRVIYLGGLGEPGSPHLRSRHETAGVLAAEGPPLTYFRAAMVVGAGSESFRTLYYLARRLPVMVAPAWLRVRTQPIGIDEVLAYLRAAPDTPTTLHPRSTAA